MVEDLMYFFDKMYVTFPTLYHNTAPGKFGGINAVKMGKPKSIPFLTTDESSKYNYSSRFFLPLYCGITELMTYNDTNKTISWRHNPNNIDLSKLELNQYVDLIKMVSFDPQKIRKGKVFYVEAENAFRKIV